MSREAARGSNATVAGRCRAEGAYTTAQVIEHVGVRKTRKIAKTYAEIFELVRAVVNTWI
jgi:hypothetical protein